MNAYQDSRSPNAGGRRVRLTCMEQRIQVALTTREPSSRSINPVTNQSFIAFALNPIAATVPCDTPLVAQIRRIGSEFQRGVMIFFLVPHFVVVAAPRRLVELFALEPARVAGGRPDRFRKPGHADCGNDTSCARSTGRLQHSTRRARSIRSRKPLRLTVRSLGITSIRIRRIPDLSAAPMGR